MKENKGHLVLHRASLQVLIHNVAVKIFRRAQAPQIVQELHVKLVMVPIHEVHVLHLWSAINLVCVHVFLNQIFLKM
jgi:hypothetical protein